MSVESAKLTSQHRMLLEVYIHWNFEYLSRGLHLQASAFEVFVFLIFLPLSKRTFSVDFLSDVFEFYKLF